MVVSSVFREEENLIANPRTCGINESIKESGRLLFAQNVGPRPLLD